MRTRLNIFIVSFAALLALACGGGGGGGPAADGGAGGDGGADKGDPPAPVEIIITSTGPITDGLLATATVRARNQAEIRARASGVVSALDVEEGAVVSAGDRLARIDQPAYQSLIDTHPAVRSGGQHRHDGQPCIRRDLQIGLERHI